MVKLVTGMKIKNLFFSWVYMNLGLYTRATDENSSVRSNAEHARSDYDVGLLPSKAQSFPTIPYSAQDVPQYTFDDHHDLNESSTLPSSSNETSANQLTQAELENKFLELGNDHIWTDLHQYRKSRNNNLKWRDLCYALWSKQNMSNNYKKTCSFNRHLVPKTRMVVFLHNPVKCMSVDLLKCECYFYRRSERKIKTQYNNFYVHKFTENQYFIMKFMQQRYVKINELKSIRTDS